VVENMAWSKINRRLALSRKLTAVMAALGLLTVFFAFFLVRSPVKLALWGLSFNILGTVALILPYFSSEKEAYEKAAMVFNGNEAVAKYYLLQDTSGIIGLLAIGFGFFLQAISLW
jgi:hypothetical protein